MRHKFLFFCLVLLSLFTIHTFLKTLGNFPRLSLDQTDQGHEHHYHYVIKHKRHSQNIFEAEANGDDTEQLYIRHGAEERLPIYRLKSSFLSRKSSMTNKPLEHPGNKKRPSKIQNPCLPSLLVIGTQKGGTTSWHVYLKNGYHPQFLVPFGLKETNYFNKFIERGQTFPEYLTQFPGNENGTDAIIGSCSSKHTETGAPFIRAESSPNYLVHPFAAERSFQYLPHAKVLVMLRNPINRVVSAYNMKWQEKMCGDNAWKMSNCYEILVNETVSIQSLRENWEIGLRETVETELSILLKCYDNHQRYSDKMHLVIEKCLGFKQMDSIQLFRHLEDHSHIYRSIYADQLERWFNIYPTDALEVWSSEEFERNPKDHMKSLVFWFDMDPSVVNDSHLSSSKAHTRDYISTIPEDVDRKLKAFFKPHDQRLFNLLKKKGISINLLRKNFERY